MTERWRSRIVFSCLFALSLSISFWREQNFDEQYWSVVITGSVCIAGLATWLMNAWRELPPQNHVYWVFFLYNFIFWLCVFFWWTNDYSMDYWRDVFTAALLLSLLVLPLRWGFLRLRGAGAKENLVSELPTPVLSPQTHATPGDGKSSEQNALHSVERQELPASSEKPEEAVLFGEPGESVAYAAARFAIEVRHRGKDKWLGRRGDDCYWMEYPPRSSASSKKSQPVFQRLTESEVSLFAQLSYFGLDADRFWSRLWEAKEGEKIFGWKVLQRGSEEISYDRQRYDGDFAHFVEVEDPVGRRIHFQDHGDHFWVLECSENIAKPKWEW